MCYHMELHFYLNSLKYFFIILSSNMGFKFAVASSMSTILGFLKNNLAKINLWPLNKERLFPLIQYCFQNLLAIQKLLHLNTFVEANFVISSV